VRGCFLLVLIADLDRPGALRTPRPRTVAWATCIVELTSRRLRTASCLAQQNRAVSPEGENDHQHRTGIDWRSSAGWGASESGIPEMHRGGSDGPEFYLPSS